MKTAKRKNDVIFLLGAGASVEAGIYTSNEITDTLVNYGSNCPSENTEGEKDRVAAGSSISTICRLSYRMGTKSDISHL